MLSTQVIDTRSLTIWSRIQSLINAYKKIFKEKA
jgi:hypothetical protein